MPEKLVAVEFRSKPPHNTMWLHITVEPGNEAVNEFADLAGDLIGIGWMDRPAIVEEPDTSRPWSIDYRKPGSDPFGGWKPVQKRAFLEEVRRVLRRHGHIRIPYRKLEMAELA